MVSDSFAYGVKTRCELAVGASLLAGKFLPANTAKSFLQLHFAAMLLDLVKLECESKSVYPQTWLVPNHLFR